MLTAFMLAATVAPAPPLTLQQQFDAATTALAAGKWAEAEAQFAALERRDDGRPSVSLAVSHVRRGIALSHLDRLPEAETELETGLATLPKARPELVQDRGDGTLALASIAEEWLDYPDAARMYQVARDLAPDSQTKLDSLAGLARVTMFTDSAGAVAIADAALKLALAQPALNPTIPGLRTLRGRALLNDHRFAEAQTELRLAVKQLGGLTATVDRADITARSDFAVAALLAGQSAVARIALAYTGAGLADADLDFAADAVPPPCGGADGLVPDDVAVVEFSIRDDGSVGNPRPIYASRQGPVAVAFARAVASWSWTSEKAQRIKPFFRQTIRLEMRCATGASRPGIDALLRNDVDAWYQVRGISPSSDEPAMVRRATIDRTELARREAAGGSASPQLLPLLAALSESSVLPEDERHSLAERALSIARAEKAPPALLGKLMLTSAFTNRQLRRPRNLEHRLAAIRDVVADPAISHDPRTVAALRLVMSDTLVAVKRPQEAIPLASAIGADDALDVHDPLRVGANVRLASLRLATGDLAAAREAYSRTGLSAQECALVDAQPVRLSKSLRLNGYPVEAERWGFSGWVRTEFDITADGHTSDPRAVFVYPPFVFEPSAISVLSHARFEQTYRPEGALGCGSATQDVHFKRG